MMDTKLLTLNLNGERTLAAITEMIGTRPLDADSLAMDLQTKMRAGPVLFVFEKADGTARMALGTLDPKHIPQKTAELFSELMTTVEAVERVHTELINGNKSQEALVEPIKAMQLARVAMVQERVERIEQGDTKPGNVTYFDLGAMAWRSCLKAKLLLVISA